MSRMSSQNRKRVYCSVPGCRNNCSNKDISFHKLPRDKILREKWIEACKMMEIATTNTKICSDHFDKRFYMKKLKRRKLLRYAVPLYNLPKSLDEAYTLKLLSRNNQTSNQQYNFSEDSGCLHDNIQQIEPEYCNLECLLSENEDEIKNEPEYIDDQFESFSEYEDMKENLKTKPDNCNNPFESCPMFKNEADGLDKDNLQIRVGEDDEECEGCLLSDDPDNKVQQNCDEKCEGCLLSAYMDDAKKLDDLDLDEILVELKKANLEYSESAVERKIAQSVQSELENRTSILDFISSDAELDELIGINNETLMTLVDYIKWVAQEKEIVLEDKYSLSVREMVALTLIKLRHDLTFAFIRLLFGISKQSCASCFKLLLPLLSLALKTMEYWPEENEILDNMPTCFKPFSKTRVILDCTEILIQKPKCLSCLVRRHFEYHGKTTLKLLVGMSPCGLVVFHFHAFGSRSSFKDIFLKSEILEELSSGDAVMADKRLHIRSECDEQNVRLISPIDSSGKQLTEKDTLFNAGILDCRVHVELLMERIKSWKCLKTIISWIMTPYLDDVITAVVGLVNLKSPMLENKIVDSDE